MSDTESNAPMSPSQGISGAAPAPVPPPPESSTLTLPISVSAAFLEHSLDRVLEALYPEKGLLYQSDLIDIGGGLNGTAQVRRRGNTHIAMNNNAIVATMPLRVVLKPAWKPGVGMLSLPFDINLPLDINAEYTVRLRSQPRLDANYNLRLDATFEYSVDRAVGIEAVGLDMGISFGKTTRRAAEEALHNLCDWLNSEDFQYLNFREQVSSAWEALQQPVNLSPGQHVRLEITPEKVLALPFRSQGDNGVIGLAVVAMIRAQTTSEAEIQPTPLPPITPGTPTTGVTIVLPFEISFETMKETLRARILDQPWHLDGRKVVLRGVEIEGSDDGELRVRVDLSVTSESGSYEIAANLSASGKPRLNSSKQHLSLAGFQYDAHTDNRLLNFAARILRPFAGTLLEPWLEMPLRPHALRLLQEANMRLEAGITLNDGVRLFGKAGDVRLVHLSVTSHGLALQVETHGELALRIHHTP